MLGNFGFMKTMGLYYLCVARTKALITVTAQLIYVFVLVYMQNEGFRRTRLRPLFYYINMTMEYGAIFTVCENHNLQIFSYFLGNYRLLEQLHVSDIFDFKRETTLIILEQKRERKKKNKSYVQGGLNYMYMLA